MVVVIKVIDYGWTAYDIWQSTQVLNDPNSTQEQRDLAALNVSMAVAFELAEPDDETPIALPIDDLARHGVIAGAKEIGAEAAELTARELTGQGHHILSNQINNALSAHSSLRGVFDRDGFIARALDLQSHVGYQDWHRAYDAEVVEWLRNPRNANASPEQFLLYLKEIYERPEIAQRFPDADDLIQMALEEYR